MDLEATYCYVFLVGETKAYDVEHGGGEESEKR